MIRGGQAGGGGHDVVIQIIHKGKQFDLEINLVEFFRNNRESPTAHQSAGMEKY